ncbi:MAG TPA: pyrroline-5-carboxylate reductase dimerization domain-containing protein [Baekduia sp.]|nr:pyrroline-5-carboxylate reductase dimerization domain-containing protein [Baekduia sp.]
MIGVVGSGNLARALVRGWNEPVLITDSGSGSGEELAAEVGGQRCDSNAELARTADILILCHKPHQLADVAAEMTADAKTVISTLARVTLDELKDAYPQAKVARVMPSIAAELGQGLTVIAEGGEAQAQAESLFARVGETVVVAESQVEAATAIGGVGPAYAALVVEAWSAAGVNHGLTQAQATRMAVASLAGGAALIAARQDDAAAVREAVSSPGGVTLKGLAALEAGGIREAFEDATTAVIG